MAPQTSIPIPATVLGLIGTVFWCVQLLPQIWHSHRTKSTEGLPWIMPLLWSWSSMPFAVYAISQNFNIPLWVQPQCFGLFCMISWGQVMIYSKYVAAALQTSIKGMILIQDRRRWPIWKSVAACASMLGLNAGCQVAFVLVLRPRYERGLDWPVFLFGVLATVCLLSGYVPIPFELIKRRGRIVGISLWFLLIDWTGAFFSLLSLGRSSPSKAVVVQY